MRLYDSLDKKKKIFDPLDKKVTIYVCGVTTSDYSHLGHAFSSMVFEVLQRYLEYRTFQVKRVQNFTDVDDKIIDKAMKEKLTMKKVSEKYIDAFLEDMDQLGVSRANYYPKATKEIPNIIKFITKLETRGFTYTADGSVYFRVHKKKHYGKLSGRDINNITLETRVDTKNKEHPADFALWKKSKENEPFWDSPWGNGRPGWHIECSSMVLSNFGDSVDIHGGGLDLLFPHHENEIAQSEALTDKKVAEFWMHNGLLEIAGDKMSKSTGNFLRLRDALKLHSPNSLRFWMLSTHYRNPIIYDKKNINAQVKAIRRLKDAVIKSNKELTIYNTSNFNSYRKVFEEYMDDDLNTPKAISVLFNLARKINKLKTEGQNMTKGQELLIELASILGINLEKEENIAVRPLEINKTEIEELIQKRNEFRKLKLFKEADDTREKLSKLGIEISDSNEGTIWRKIS